MGQTEGELFFSDVRVREAKRLLAEAVAEHSNHLHGVRPADEGRVESYEAVLQAFAAARGAPLFYKYVGSGIGNGALVELADGSVKYDLISGIGVHGWGHSHPDIIAAGIDAALSDVVMQGNLQQNAVALDVMQLFLQLAQKKGAQLAHCFLTTSGAMANENALKIACQKTGGSRVLAFSHCFAGRTLALAQVTDKALYRSGLPDTLAVDYVPFYDATDPEGSTQRSCDVVQTLIERWPKAHASMIFELIQGEGGYYPGERKYFRKLMSIVRDAGILVHVDEIQTFGRTDHAFAFQHFECDDLVDMVTVGKYSQTCATLYKKELQPRPGLLSQTFTASSSALHAARVLLKEMCDGDLFGSEGRITTGAQFFSDGLLAISQRHPELVSGPFGYGAMCACTPYGGDLDRAVDLSRRLFDAGILSFVAGSYPKRIRFLPPVAVMSKDAMTDALAIIEAVLVEGA